jgi:peptidoglycan/xylan/chitin deacetylase (PgdA/CDA1 family)/glycosyltransferase involved in cell wall biosynthesis
MFVTLLYHIVDRRIDEGIAISEEAFDEQLEHLRREGYAVLTLADVLRVVSGEPPPERAVLLTFDDGYADNLDLALPRLRAHGMEATLFVPTAHVGCNNGWNARARQEVRHLEWRELEQWLDGGGQIGAHTHDHRSVFEMPPVDFGTSLDVNRRLLEDRLGIDVVAFAYPYGVTTIAARDEVARRFDVAWVVEGGTWDPRRDRFQLNRQFVGKHTSIRDFGRELEDLFDYLATGRTKPARSPVVRRPMARPTSAAAPAPSLGPRVALVAGTGEDPVGWNSGQRFRDLLEDGWDVHLLQHDNGHREADRDCLSDEVLRERVHPPPRPLRSRRPRPGLLAGLLRTLLQRPRQAVAGITRPAGPGERYLRAVLLGLRPDLVYFLSDAEAAAWLGPVQAAGARSVTQESLVTSTQAVDRSLFTWHPPSVERPALHVLAVGPLVWQQGFEHLLHAIRLLADDGVRCECRIVGDGDHEDAVSFARHQLELGDAVELYPPSGRDWFLDHLEWADVVVNPAVVPTSPPWLLDAHAAGRAVVLTEGTAGAEEPALVVPRRDAAALAEALARLARGGELRTELAERGRRHTSQSLDTEAHAMSFRALCRTTLDA